MTPLDEERDDARNPAPLRGQNRLLAKAIQNKDTFIVLPKGGIEYPPVGYFRSTNGGYTPPFKG